MPTTKAIIRQLVTRLCTLPAQDVTVFVDPQDVRDELGRSLEKYAATDDHAERIVERLMEGRFRPIRAEIRDTADSVPAIQRTGPIEPEVSEPNCILCGDGGLVGGTADTPWSWCGCPSGVHLRSITPELVDEANRNLEKIRGKFPKGVARKVMA